MAGSMRSWEIRWSSLRMYAVKAARSRQRETIRTSSGSRSERQTSRSMKPSTQSTRCARRRKAATSASDWAASTRSRDIDTYIARNASAVRLCARERVSGADRIACQQLGADAPGQLRAGARPCQHEAFTPRERAQLGLDVDQARGHHGGDDDGRG